MSYILDSLKKSEQQRRDGSLPGLQSEPLGPVPPSGHRRAWIAGLLVTCCVGVALLAWFLVARPPQRSEQQTSVPSAAISPTSLPATGTPGGPQAALETSVALEKQRSEEPAKVQGAVTSPVVVREAQPVQSAVPESPLLPPVIPLYGWNELPQGLRQGLPALQLSMHYYAGRDQGGLVRLNGQMLRPGDALEGGLVVDEIVPEGVVLKGQGFKVLLERP